MVQAAQDHDAANIIEACKGVEPFDRAGFETGQRMFDVAGEAAKFVARQMHEFVD